MPNVGQKTMCNTDYKTSKIFFFKNLENESFDKFETTKIDENNKTPRNETGRENR